VAISITQLLSRVFSHYAKFHYVDYCDAEYSYSECLWVQSRYVFKVHVICNKSCSLDCSSADWRYTYCPYTLCRCADCHGAVWNDGPLGHPLRRRSAWPSRLRVSGVDVLSQNANNESVEVWTSKREAF